MQMTHKSKHNIPGFPWPVPENPRRGRFSTETSLGNEDLKFSVSNGVGLILDDTVKIILFDATLGSKNYRICKMHVNNIFPRNGGQPISLYGTISNNGLFYNKQFRTPIMCDIGKLCIFKQNPY